MARIAAQGGMIGQGGLVEQHLTPQRAQTVQQALQGFQQTVVRQFGKQADGLKR